MRNETTKRKKNHIENQRLQKRNINILGGEGVFLGRKKRRTHTHTSTSFWLLIKANCSFQLWYLAFAWWSYEIAYSYWHHYRILLAIYSHSIDESKAQNLCYLLSFDSWGFEFKLQTHTLSLQCHFDYRRNVRLSVCSTMQNVPFQIESIDQSKSTQFEQSRFWKLS